jgi:hypothetical protein
LEGGAPSPPLIEERQNENRWRILLSSFAMSN